MTLLAFAYNKSQVLMTADSGLITAANQPADRPALPVASVTEIHKLRRVANLNLVWALTGDPAEARKIKDFLETDQSADWNALAVGLGEQTAQLNEDARKRQRRAGVKKKEIVQSALLIAGYVDHLDAVIVHEDGNHYFASTTPLPAAAVGVYGPLFNIAWQVAVSVKPQFSIDDPTDFHALVSSLCKTGLIPGLMTPIDICLMTKDSCQLLGKSVFVD